MKWLYLLCVVGCHAGETKTLDDVVPEDEVWLGPAQMTKANIQVAVAAPHDLVRSIHAGGKIAFDDLRVTHVYSPVTGHVTHVLAKPGDRLKRGAPLISVLSPDVGAAFSDVIKANADLQSSQADFQREARLLAEDATSKRNYDSAEDVYRKARAEHERAQQRASLLHVGAVDAVTQEYTLRTFIDGEVIARNVNPGIEVLGQYSGGASVELFTIGDIKSVWVNVDVADRELSSIHIGDGVAVTVMAYPGRVFHGKIDYISSTVDPVLRTGRVRATLPNESEELKPEMYASVAIAQPPTRQLAIAHDAVVAINEAKYVYVAHGARPDGRMVFKRRAVSVGDESEGLVPVLDGLQAGERFVVEGSVSRDQPNDEVWITPSQLSKGQITTAVVATRDVPEAISIGGRLTFDDTQISHIFSPVSGRITKLLAEPGQHVAKGTPLVAITSPDVGTYLSDLVKADADRALAEHELQRQQELFANHIGAKRDLDAAEDMARRARAEYERAKQLTQLVKSADFDVVSQQYVLRAPIAGDVIARKASPGLEVQGEYSNGGTNAIELFTIGDLGRLWVLGDVYEADLPHISEGDVVAIHPDAFPGRQFDGHVDWVADVLDPVSHTAKVRCLVENTDHKLKPEMYEAVEINVAGKQVVAVPREAVMRIEGQTVVFVQTGQPKPDGRIVFTRRKIVAKLESRAPWVPVFSGLQAGDTVAVKHSLMLLGML